MQLLSLKCFVLATHEQACYIDTNNYIYIYTHTIYINMYKDVSMDIGIDYWSHKVVV